MTHTDLKPCPWCQHDPYPDPQCMWSDAAKRQIWCENCDASGPVKDGDAEAITAWNTRARTPDTAPNQSADGKQYAYTGPMPDKGYVGFFNITELGTGLVRVTVRQEGENPVLAEFVMPSEKLFDICWDFIGGNNE